MGIYIGNTIRATKRVRPLIMYTCSKCDKYNQFVHDVVGDGKVFTISNPYSEKTQLLREKACAIAEKDLHNKLQLFEEGIHSSEYANLRLVHRCTYCGHVEPWVSRDMGDDSKCTLAGAMLVVVMVITGTVMLFVKPMLGVMIMSMGVLAGMLIDTLLAIRKKARVKKECIKLPESALPRIRKYL